MVEDILYLNFLQEKYSPKLLVFSDILLMAIFAVITPSDGVKVRNSPVVRLYSGRMTYKKLIRR